MFEQAFKKIDDILRKDAGVSSELDYIEQTSWLLFLKYLDALEQDRAQIADTLELNNNDIQKKDRHDVILANPPFGGRERIEVQQNFPIKTSETAFLFLQHFIRKLRAGGRAGIGPQITPVSFGARELLR